MRFRSSSTPAPVFDETGTTGTPSTPESFSALMLNLLSARSILLRARIIGTSSSITSMASTRLDSRFVESATTTTASFVLSRSMSTTMLSSPDPEVRL